MQTKIQKWGNSLGLRVPKGLAQDGGLEPGALVELSVREGNLVVRPARPRRYRLDALLRRVTATNRHGEIDSGPPVGKEVW